MGKINDQEMSLKRHKTEHEANDRPTDHKKLELLERIIEIASQQKLLPKFVYEMDAQCAQGRNKRFLEYQKIVKNLYGEEGKSPLKYDPEQAMTEQQKLQRKITKLQNHELEIDYFERIKTKNGNIVPTFKASQLQKLNHPTKKEFLMFSDFNQKKFIKSYSRIFDDQLQLKQTSLFRKQRVKTVSAIPENDDEDSSKVIPKPKFNRFQIEQLKEKQKGLTKVKNIKLKPLTQHVAAEKTVNMMMPLKLANPKYKPHIEKNKVGKMLNGIEPSLLHEKMVKIGSYPASVSQNSISLTKESLAKFVRSLYEREVRIIDFLQVKPAFSLEDYTALCTKLKLMQVEHILFMTFLSYDFNNDGYICENDIRRFRNLVETKKNKILQEDLKLIEAIKQKRQFEAKVLFQQESTHLEKLANPASGVSNYLQLYKLSEVTESAYFNWLKRQEQIKNNQNEDKTITKDVQSGKDLKNDETAEKEQKEQEKKNKINLFNPSVLKFKFSYFQEKADVRKYIMGIKSTKIYIGFEEFRSKYKKREENRHFTQSVQSRVLLSSKITREVSKVESGITSSRYDQCRSQVKIDPSKREFKYQYQESIRRPYLWYDLMDKLAGIRFEGLKYD